MTTTSAGIAVTGLVAPYILIGPAEHVLKEDPEIFLTATGDKNLICKCAPAKAELFRGEPGSYTSPD